MERVVYQIIIAVISVLRCALPIGAYPQLMARYDTYRTFSISDWLTVLETFLSGYRRVATR